jgi:hypothetical protein
LTEPPVRFGQLERSQSKLEVLVAESVGYSARRFRGAVLRADLAPRKLANSALEHLLIGRELEGDHRRRISWCSVARG